eukprot:TRINITY_DN22308_c0_g1_i1.p4 TRINITY_DN22308_c0_g1~~TRINITY_DN22308_c0_g1_i1.p4  ORF type:complete len:117 (+),score=2.88 TRINITY_DN22308_c0_g1_i1:312-662(+)
MRVEFFVCMFKGGREEGGDQERAQFSLVRCMYMSLLIEMVVWLRLGMQWGSLPQSSVRGEHQRQRELGEIGLFLPIGYDAVRRRDQFVQHTILMVCMLCFSAILMRNICALRSCIY